MIIVLSLRYKFRNFMNVAVTCQSVQISICASYTAIFSKSVKVLDFGSMGPPLATSATPVRRPTIGSA